MATIKFITCLPAGEHAIMRSVLQRIAMKSLEPLAYAIVLGVVLLLGSAMK